MKKKGGKNLMCMSEHGTVQYVTGRAEHAMLMGYRYARWSMLACLLILWSTVVNCWSRQAGTVVVFLFLFLFSFVPC
ncbi:hypothetical protein HOY82DRAFT_568614 [Tuber indicum]|nr:hypothetical protein HOY82DRAFT_568614 [Tuber indicum]